jgi:hypothetical protein
MHAHVMRDAAFQFQIAQQDFPHAELFLALERHSELRFKPAWSSVGAMVCYAHENQPQWACFNPPMFFCV